MLAISRFMLPPERWLWCPSNPEPPGWRAPLRAFLHRHADLEKAQEEIVEYSLSHMIEYDQGEAGYQLYKAAEAARENGLTPRDRWYPRLLDVLPLAPAGRKYPRRPGTFSQA